MVRIFRDKLGKTEFVIQTTALDCDTYMSELSDAMAACLGDDAEVAIFGILKNAMPIAFKLAGYKADTVSEQRTLVNGTVAPENCEVLSSAGR